MNPEHPRWQFGVNNSNGEKPKIGTRDEISFGPFVSKSSGPLSHMDGFEDTGFSVEFATADGAVTIPIYRNTKRHPQPSFQDYVCFKCDVPFHVPYEAKYHSYYIGGLCLTFESILVTLYSDYKVPKPITEVLTEFRECLRIHLNEPYKPVPMQVVIPEVAAHGFDVCGVLACPKTLCLGLSWIFPQERQVPGPPARVSAGFVRFKPRPDKTLDEGTWITPKFGHTVYLMQKVLKKLFRGSPLELLTPEGRKLVLEKFEWTPMSLLTRSQQREAKIEFARKNPDLLNRPKDLARALKEAKFYTRNTPSGKIAKHLGSIIDEGKRGLG